VQGKRVEGIDFWRGAALAIILVNHIPGNVLGAITPRNFGKDRRYPITSKYRPEGDLP